MEVEYQLAGEGYGATAVNPKGGIAPLSKLDLYLPAGAKLHPAGFGSCTAATLRNVGPIGCPTSSIASSVGRVLAEVTFGSERVGEEAELRAFFGEGGQLFYTAGHSPVALEITSKGHYAPSHASPYGERFETLIPPVATVPGAALASVKTIKIRVGAAIKKDSKVIPYLTLPTKCKGGLPFKTELTFGGQEGGEREFGVPAKTVSAAYKAPCP